MPDLAITPPLTHTLTTARMVIRAYQLDDAEALYQTVAASREHIGRWLPWPPQHASVADTRNLISQFRAWWQAGDDVTYGVFARTASGANAAAAADGEGERPGRLLGGLGLHVRQRDVPSYEIGYWLAADAEGHGYISEAATALVDYILRELGARRVEIRCDARNTRSAAVARRLGFEQEGVLRHERRAVDGGLRDTLIFARVV